MSVNHVRVSAVTPTGTHAALVGNITLCMCSKCYVCGVLMYGSKEEWQVPALEGEVNSKQEVDLVNGHEVTHISMYITRTYALST